MILGVDHIALSCADLRAASSLMERAGFRIEFLHSELPNPKQKQRFVSIFTDFHGLSYCRSTSGIAIELTRHAAPLSLAASAYQILLSAPLPHSKIVGDTLPQELLALGEVWSEVQQTDVVPLTSGPLNAQYWTVAQGGTAEGMPPMVMAVLVCVEQLRRSAAIWTGVLGCRTEAQGQCGSYLWQAIRFESPVPAWSVRVILVEGAPVKTAMLDQAGFPCLALLTNRIEDDLRRLESRGAEVGKVFRITPGKKELNVAMLRCSCSELLELIEITR